MGTPLFAQDAEPSAPPVSDSASASQPAASEAIIVTGSRIVRDGFQAPTPVTVVGGELMQNLGQVSAADTLRIIPQNVGTQSDATAGASTNPDVGASFANLRGLNPRRGTRTLTLVNSRRFVPSSDGGAVDLNLVPAAMIERVEVVTGGASAAYGSDAIAGVVNVLLDTDLEGIRAQADYGQTFRGDGESYHGSLVWGSSFAGGRGHVVLGGEYQKNDGIGECARVRLWCSESYNVYTNASLITPGGGRGGYDVPGSPTYGQPNFIIGPDGKNSYNDARGVVRASRPAPQAAWNYRFTEDGLGIVQYDPGQYVSTSLTGARQGGDGVSQYDDSDIQTPVERYVGYLYGEYEFSDSITAFTELTYAKREGLSTPVTAGPRSSFYIKSGNPFIPAELETLLNGASFSLGKDVDDVIISVNTSDATVYRGLVGLKGELGADWTWDAYYQYGRNERLQTRTNSRVNTPFQYAIDAVRAPDGSIVCAELLKPNPDPVAEGCVPLNLFGLNNIDPAAAAYAYRPIMQDFEYTQHVLAGTVQGELFSGFGAGPVRVAAGAEYRKETGDVYHGDIPNYTDYAFTFGLDYAGEIEVAEGFGEINIPVFSDSPLGEAFDLDAAVRYTSNTAQDTLSGEEKTTGVTSWKVSAIYDVFSSFRLRASRSRDIRAAGFRELFLKNVPTEEGSSQGIVDNPAIPGSPAQGDDPTPILNGGSFALAPEKADTTTFGAILSPEAIPGLRLSADWYQIEIKDVITNIPGQRVLDFCTDFDLFCDRITYGSPTDITFIDARQVNLGQLTVRGFDLELAYALPLDSLGADLPGQLSLRVLGNHQYDFLVSPDPTVPSVDYAGQSGPADAAGDFNPTPSWVWNGFLSYDDDAFNATFSVRHIAKGILDVEKIGPEDEGYDPSLKDSVNINRVPARTYFGLAMSYQFALEEDRDQYIEVFGAIDNLFDTKPPVAPGFDPGGGSAYPTNPVYYDTFGSRFRAGVRVRY
jgi:outer membrane receptor protein involved in Fe transport